MIDAEVKKAAEVIRSGGVILYPTDTIWGIGCDARDSSAVQRIYEIKQRSDSKSMIVLAGGNRMLATYLEQIPEAALMIIQSSVKPTTIIYPGATKLAPNLLANDGSVGIRIPSDDFCQRLIKETGFPIVSTSANISGNPAPASFRDIEPVILKKVDLVVDWRQKDNTPSAPSTIIKLHADGKTTVLRP